jgi:hypothetical protein
LDTWLLLQLAFLMFAILSIFSALAGVLYERRHELGLETWHSPERKAERLQVEERKQSQRAIDDAYGKMRVGEHVVAWKLLQTWLASKDNDLEEYRWLCGRLTYWSDPRYVTRLTEEYVDRLLVLKRNGEALDMVTQRLRLDPGFRPKTAAATLQIAQIAAQGGAPRTARALLADFTERFAGDPCVEAAGALARELTK